MEPRKIVALVNASSLETGLIQINEGSLAVYIKEEDAELFRDALYEFEAIAESTNPPPSVHSRTQICKLSRLLLDCGLNNHNKKESNMPQDSNEDEVAKLFENLPAVDLDVYNEETAQKLTAEVVSAPVVVAAALSDDLKPPLSPEQEAASAALLEAILLQVLKETKSLES